MQDEQTVTIKVEGNPWGQITISPPKTVKVDQYLGEIPDVYGVPTISQIDFVLKGNDNVIIEVHDKALKIIVSRSDIRIEPILHSSDNFSST